MPRLQSRQDLIDYCLRRLGEPVIQVAQNLDPDQIEDRIDDAFQFFHDYHFDGVEKSFLPIQITQDHIDDRYIQVPDDVMSIIKVVPFGNAARKMGMFDVQYQMRLNDLYTFSSQSLIYYDMMQRHLSLLQFEFNVEPGIQYTRHQGRLSINHDWGNLEVGSYIIIECYRALDPEVYNNIYDDRWLKLYATELIRRQWGENLSKHSGIVLVGGVTLNGIDIWNKANENLEKLEQQVKDEFQLPVDFMTG